MVSRLMLEASAKDAAEVKQKLTFKSLGRPVVPSRGGCACAGTAGLDVMVSMNADGFLFQHTFSTVMILPMNSVVFRATMAASASSTDSIVTKPNPRDSLEWGPYMTEAFLTYAITRQYLDERQ